MGKVYALNNGVNEAILDLALKPAYHLLVIILASNSVL